MTSFGIGSTVEVETLTWKFHYFTEPRVREFPNEKGLHLHLAAADLENLQGAIEAGAAAVGLNLGASAAPVASALGLVARFAHNGDGSLDLHLAPDGLQVGPSHGIDPNFILGPAWQPMREALQTLVSLPSVS